MRRTFHLSSSDLLPAEKSDFIWDLYHHLLSRVDGFCSFFLCLIDDRSYKYNILFLHFFFFFPLKAAFNNWLEF